MKIDKLIKIFWNVEDKIIHNKDNTFSCEVVFTSKYGKLGVFVWYLIERAIELCRSLILTKPKT